jgi:predicted ATPase
VAVENSRPRQRLVVAVGDLTVITGASGSGQSSFDRMLRLLTACADGNVTATLAGEGGMASALWAGESEHDGKGCGPVALRIGFGGRSVGLTKRWATASTSAWRCRRRRRSRPTRR